MKKWVNGIVSLGTALGLAGCVADTAEPAIVPVAQIGGAESARVAAVMIVSEPRDAMVVVNRHAVGITPRVLELPVTPQGYLAEPVSIAVRFVARDVTEASVTSAVTLQMTDRAPARLEFKREDVRRIFAD